MTIASLLGEFQSYGRSPKYYGMYDLNYLVGMGSVHLYSLAWCTSAVAICLRRLNFFAVLVTVSIAVSSVQLTLIPSTYVTQRSEVP
jgi:hypothetical protein